MVLDSTDAAPSKARPKGAVDIRLTSFRSSHKQLHNDPFQNTGGERRSRGYFPEDLLISQQPLSLPSEQMHYFVETRVSRMQRCGLGEHFIQPLRANDYCCWRLMAT